MLSFVSPIFSFYNIKKLIKIAIDTILFYSLEKNSFWKLFYINWLK